MTLRQTIRQTWWAPIAALAGAIQLVVAVTAAFNSSDDGESRVAGATILLIGAAVMFAGLFIRPERRVRGNALILIGCCFTIFWFWTVVLPIAGIIVAVGVLTSGWREPRSVRSSS